MYREIHSYANSIWDDNNNNNNTTYIIHSSVVLLCIDHFNTHTEREECNISPRRRYIFMCSVSHLSGRLGSFVTGAEKTFFWAIAALAVARKSLNSVFGPFYAFP